MNSHLNTLIPSVENVIIKEGGDQVSVNRLTSLSSNDVDSINSFSSEYNNPIKSNSDFLVKTGLRLEVVNEFVPEGKATISLNVKESLVMAFNNDFLDQYSKGLFITQPVPYSDKNSEFVKVFNLDSNFRIGSETKSLRSFSNDELTELHFNNVKSYYEGAINKVTNDLASILNINLGKDPIKI